MNLAGIAEVAAAVIVRVAVENFPVGAIQRQSDAVVAARHRSKIKDGDDCLALTPMAHEGEQRALRILAVQPGKTAF